MDHGDNLAAFQDQPSDSSSCWPAGLSWEAQGGICFQARSGCWQNPGVTTGLRSPAPCWWPRGGTGGEALRLSSRAFSGPCKWGPTSQGQQLCWPFPAWEPLTPLFCEQPGKVLCFGGPPLQSPFCHVTHLQVLGIRAWTFWGAISLPLTPSSRKVSTPPSGVVLGHAASFHLISGTGSIGTA